MSIYMLFNTHTHTHTHTHRNRHTHGSVICGLCLVVVRQHDEVCRDWRRKESASWAVMCDRRYQRTGAGSTVTDSHHTSWHPPKAPGVVLSRYGSAEAGDVWVHHLSMWFSLLMFSLRFSPLAFAPSDSSRGSAGYPGGPEAARRRVAAFSFASR